tara:strand:+ start:634 stop:1632 length:999 start_codon:yes stop_codon:yes gene_type:complete
MSTKVNVDNFFIGSKWNSFKWDVKRRYPLSYFINRLQWYYYPKKGAVPNFPLHVDFESCAACDLHCPMCFRERADYSGTSMKTMKLDLFKKGVDECVKYNLYSLRLSWRGEPTVNPHLVDMVSYAKKMGVKEVSFFTHGGKLEDKLAKELVRAGVDWITISVDDLEENYDKIRAPLTFKGTVERAKNLRHLRDNLGGGYPKIRINGVWDDDKGTDWFKEMHNYFSPIVDYMTFTPEYKHDGSPMKMKPDFTCQYPFQRISVMWDGVIPLCLADKHPEYVIGNLNDSSIYDIWHGDRMKEARKLHLEHKSEDLTPCQKCYRANTRQVGNISIK